MNSAIIVAGGDSSRIDDIIPKQYIILDGREILNYSATTFLNHPAIDEVVIVCKPEWINHVTSHYQKCKIVKMVKLSFSKMDIILIISLRNSQNEIDKMITFLRFRKIFSTPSCWI